MLAHTYASHMFAILGDGSCLMPHTLFLATGTFVSTTMVDMTMLKSVHTLTLR